MCQGGLQKKFILALKMIFEVFGGPMKPFLKGFLSKVCHVKVAITTIFLAIRRPREAVREEMKFLDQSILF